MAYMVPVLIALAVIPTAYFFFVFRRILKTAGLDPKRPVFVIADILLCLVVWHFTCQVTTTGAILLYLFLIVDLIVLLADFAVRKIAGGSEEKAGMKIWRRIVGFCIIPLAFSVFSFVYGGFNIRNVIETHYTVTTQKEIPEDGYRVCFLSDVHSGVALEKDDYEAISREIESKNVDLVILGGDLLDFGSNQEDVESMFASFGSIDAADGVYYIFGNHDRTGDYKESLFTEEYIIEQCEKNGITVLQDEYENFGNGITLAGREDADTKYGRIRKTADEVFEGIDTDSFVIVADHQPKDYAELARLGADLIINGHLHAGQIFPLSVVLALGNTEHVTYGRYRITQDGNQKMAADGPAKAGEGTATAIVSSGLVGFAYAIRTTGHSEYCIIDIVRETA